MTAIKAHKKRRALLYVSLLHDAINRGKFEGIYLGRRENGALLYAGKVENGFDAAAEQRLRKRAKV